LANPCDRREVCFAPFAVRCALGENAQAHGRGRHHPGRVAGALTIMVKYPLATLALAVVLGAIGEFPAYLIERRLLLEQALTTATAYLAYYLYLSYAEGIVDKTHRKARRISLRDTFGELVGAATYVPSVLVAALIAFSVTTLAVGLLLVRGCDCTRAGRWPRR
jgi:hypothetical protein